MAFYQDPPALEDPYESDRVLRAYIRRVFSQSEREVLEPALASLSRVVLDELDPLQRADRLYEPTLTAWDPWGHRVDHIEVTALWKRAKVLAAEHGLVATGYERAYGALSRAAQFALVYLFAPSSDVYTCPLAMTDGAARTLRSHKHATLDAHAVSRLISRDPTLAWTSGQWMTERTGGSDVGRSETVARRDPSGAWSLSGTKWFTSATTSEMALTLARPEGNPEGSKGLALFYVETRDGQGLLRNISINRLKDKLGTRKVPTAELSLQDTPATLVSSTTDGVRAITPMLNVTRTWNAVCSIAFMRRSLSMARDYARKRVAFGERLADKPLHVETLADMQSEFEAAFSLTFRVCELLGLDDDGALDGHGEQLLRLLTPLAKLSTGKQAVALTSEAMECFGGAGYVEDTGLPVLLRDAQVLPIWEGTTNVLSLDVLRALARSEAHEALREEFARCVRNCRETALETHALDAQRACERALAWLARNGGELRVIEAHGRKLAMTLARSLSLALLCSHASWSLTVEGDLRPSLAAARYAQRGIDWMREGSALDDASRLAMDLS
ncbi:MAG: acyl-CoA dehydrogenase family protein [Deltaproteobacteria bacterium]|nr:acyl-CoA dehydrogenase family protein [Deltaproteobacteria bacterium]